MRFFGLIFALLATLTLAQQSNVISVPTNGFDVVAGQPFTISWTNPSSGTVSIRLTQGSNLEPGAGDLLLAGVPASAGIATFTIPEDVNMAAYNFAIVDDSDANNINFSSAFTISGGTASASASASGTASATSASASESSASSSASASASSASASASSSASSASASASSSSSSASSSASAASSSAAATTSAPSSNGAGIHHAGGIVAIMAGAIAVF